MIDTIYDLFAHVVATHRNDVAIVETNRTLSFGELSDMVDTIAEEIPDDAHSVGIVMRHRGEMIAAMLAVLKIGGRYIPAEPSFPLGRIYGMMEESKVELIVTEYDLVRDLAGFPLMMVDTGKGHPKGLVTRRAALQHPDAPAYVLYTSGTTGKPKGVCVTNGNVCHYVRAFEEEFHPGAGDRMLQYSVCSFDIFVEEVFASLLNGAALVIPTEEEKATVDKLMEFIQRHRITMVSGFPYLLAEMNRLPAIPDSLRLLISGGDVLRGHYVDHLVDQAEVYNTYGPSETTVCASYYRCNDGQVLADGTYPIGKAVKDVEIHILDEMGEPVALGEVGELCITGNGVSNGYIGRHQEENKAFCKGKGGKRLYHSGDLGYLLPSGDIAFLRRKDDQIMIYGKRVEVAEVESRLCQCRAVEQGVVRAFTDEEGLSYMTAYVVPAKKDMKLSEVRKALSENLTSFMIPEFLVKMPEIPLGENGKPDVAKLPVVLKEGTYR